jgi:hypothetical protein
MRDFPLAELPPSPCGCKTFALDAIGDHVSTSTDQSGAKKTHDWAVQQRFISHNTSGKDSTDLFIRGQGCSRLDYPADQCVKQRRFGHVPLLSK